jgi:hypothetical protein
MLRGVDRHLDLDDLRTGPAAVSRPDQRAAGARKASDAPSAKLAASERSPRCAGQRTFVPLNLLASISICQDQGCSAYSGRWLFRSGRPSLLAEARLLVVRSFLHFERATVERRHHRLHQPILGDVGV